MSREQILHRMEQERQTHPARGLGHRSPDLPIKTPNDLVTLASIVEKETGRTDERSRVAAVFINRLKHNMRLQSDPTIIYGLTRGKGTLGHALTKSEIDQANALQHLSDRGPAARPDRQSRPRLARCGCQSGAHQGALFSSPTAAAAHVFLGQLRATLEERRQAAQRRAEQRGTRCRAADGDRQAQRVQA